MIRRYSLIPAMDPAMDHLAKHMTKTVIDT